VRTVGVDLAAEPKTTAVAVIEWLPGEARVRALDIPGEDEVVLHHARTAGKVGIDCPLGWPDAFVDFVRDHQEGKPVVAHQGTAGEWRRSLANRLTDIRIRENADLKVVPLSVSTDRIGLTAMRAARLQTLLAEQGLARAAACGLTVQPEKAEREQAQREGWIALPTCSLAELTS
jgi:predicted nuclease with RNAse H fold